MLFAHFVEVTGKASFVGPASRVANAADGYAVGFVLRDSAGEPIRNATVAVLSNDARGSISYRYTDAEGRVMLVGNRASDRISSQVIGVSYAVDGQLPVTASTTITWVSTAKKATVVGGKRLVTVRVLNAKGIRVKIAVAGGAVVYRTPTSKSASFKVAAPAGTKSVAVTISGTTTRHSVKVTK
jgi:hypothetical protein